MHPPTPTIAGTKGLPSLPALSLTTLPSQDATLTTPVSSRNSNTALQNTDQQTTAAPSSATQQQQQQHPEACHCDFENERQRHLRQNHEITRLIAVKAIQIRRSEAEISQLERANLGLTLALRRAQDELQEQSSLKAALRQQASCESSVTASTSLQEEWIQLGQTQELIPYLQQQIESELLPRTQERSSDLADCGLERIDGGDLMMSLTPRSKKRKLEMLAFSSAIPRDSALLKLDHIRAIYEHEQNALLEMTRSHRSTTEIYKEALRSLSEDRARISSSSVHSTNTDGQELWNTSDGGLSQPLDPSLYCAEALLMPSYRSPQEARARTLPNFNRTLAQRSISPSPFFSVETDSVINHNAGINRAHTHFRSQPPFTSRLTNTAASGPRVASRRGSFGYSTTTSNEPALQTSSCDPVRRPRRPLSKLDVNTLPVLSEQESDLLSDETATNMSTPPRPVVPPPPPLVYMRPAKYQDLIVRNQKRQLIPSTPKSLRKQSSLSPYRRQSPSAKEKRARYVQERAKAKIQTQSLIAKFKNNGTSNETGRGAEISSSPKSKDGDATIDRNLKKVRKPATTTEDCIIDLTTPIPPASTSASAASRETVTRTPSRIPRATQARHRSKASSAPGKRRAGFNSEKLKSLTASQLLRRMNKSLLGTSRPPVLPRNIIQKGLSASVHLAVRKPTIGTLSALATMSLTSTSGMTSDLSPATTSTATSTPTTTPVQAIAIKSTVDATAIQNTAVTTTPTTINVVTTTATSTKKSARDAPIARSGRVTRSVLSDRFRRVTRSTTAAASQML
ncbi:hypothetical protein BGW39_007096 [Mortierella sp. 14UC]|nr:hypothetical protein BGW39_007096 [Mortierella sp. 14UC]